MAEQKGSSVFVGIGQGFYGAAGDRHFPQAKTRPFQFVLQFKDRTTAVEKVAVRTIGAQRPGHLTFREGLGDV
jgi:hypothetical protein